MKRIAFFLLLSVLSTATFAQAQGGRRFVNPEPVPKKHAFYAGLKAGLDFTTLTQPDEGDLGRGSGTGFSGGAVVRGRFMPANSSSPAGTGLLGLGFELKYKQNTAQTYAEDENGKEQADLSIGYFEVPVFVQLFPFYTNELLNNLYVEAGPDIAGTMSRSPKSLTLRNPRPDVSEVTYKLDMDDSKLKGFDVRLMVGLGYDFPVGQNLVGVNARYYVGTSNLAGNFQSKMNTFEVSLSWMFNIGKF